MTDNKFIWLCNWSVKVPPFSSLLNIWELFASESLRSTGLSLTTCGNSERRGLPAHRLLAADKSQALLGKYVTASETAVGTWCPCHQARPWLGSVEGEHHRLQSLLQLPRNNGSASLSGSTSASPGIATSLECTRGAERWSWPSSSTASLAQVTAGPSGGGAVKTSAHGAHL